MCCLIAHISTKKRSTNLVHSFARFTLWRSIVCSICCGHWLDVIRAAIYIDRRSVFCCVPPHLFSCFSRSTPLRFVQICVVLVLFPRCFFTSKYFCTLQLRPLRFRCHLLFRFVVVAAQPTPLMTHTKICSIPFPVWLLNIPSLNILYILRSHSSDYTSLGHFLVFLEPHEKSEGIRINSFVVGKMCKQSIAVSGRWISSVNRWKKFHPIHNMSDVDKFICSAHSLHHHSLRQLCLFTQWNHSQSQFAAKPTHDIVPNSIACSLESASYC